ncbi:YegP family protein [Chitinophaga tropicalis]|uniref:DUF1508 domain-containing protein n=1 Tax=Chitinophaga tropicalis TaxID=2683588 RepID=A0A7K1U9J0_9BACT|nr:YegP family protein [Chitinophaga tropicalis]MVT11041.1 DUF1508 domain-containing protein [Chitinophaga tropicalis]
MSNPKFEITKPHAQFYFNLKAGNGEIILSSEGYTAKRSCENGIASVQKNAPDDDQYDRKHNNGSYTFVLKAGNGEPIGRSESYTSAASRDAGIESVKRNAPNASVVDLT